LKQWAHYLISEVRYDKNHLILMAMRHRDAEAGISFGDLVDRMQIISDIANGQTYITIYNRMATWKKGNKINFFRIDGQPYLRIDENKVNQDYLGDITEIPGSVKSEPEEATPEQIARLEHLEKQIAKLDSPSIKIESEPLKITRVVLPKENTEFSKELDLLPGSVSEPEEATPEQIARLEHLEKQIAKLESKPKKESEEATPEQIARLEHLEKQIAKLELLEK